MSGSEDEPIEVVGMEVLPSSGDNPPADSTGSIRPDINIEDVGPASSESEPTSPSSAQSSPDNGRRRAPTYATGAVNPASPPPGQPAAPPFKGPPPPGPMFPETTVSIRVMQVVSLVFIGALTAGTFWLVPILSNTIFDLTGSPNTLPVGIGAVMLGLLYTLIVAFILPANPMGEGMYRRWLMVLAGFIVIVVALVGTSIQYVIWFFQWQVLLFAGAIMTFGVVRGRRWAVFVGAMLQMFEALGSTAGPEELYTLSGYGILFTVALELSYTTAGFSVVLARELAEADGPKTKAVAKSAIGQGAASYAPRVVVCIMVAALLLATGTALFLRPGTFGPAFAESLESQSALAFTLPMLLIMLVIVILLGIPDNAGSSLRHAGKRSYNSLCLFGGYIKRKIKGTPDEESPQGFESWQTDESGAELETF